MKFPLFLVLAVFCLIVPPPALAGRALALVYDDSGSMRSDERWLYANYALQTLIALMGRDDHLHLVAMSAPERVETLADSFARRRAIERLQHANAPAKNTPTPYRAVETAMNALAERLGGTEEPWLVVITDGVFDETGPAPDLTARERAFSDFLSTTGAHPVILLIGGGADRRLADAWRRAGQAEILQATDSEQIVERVRDIASVLNARDRQPADLGAHQDGQEIWLSPRFPLRRLTVLAQGDGRNRRLTRVAGITARNGEVRAERFDLAMVQPARRGGRSVGMVTHIWPAAPAAPLPEGHEALRLTFADPVGQGDVQLFPEVAARLEVELRGAAGTRFAPDRNGVIPICAGQRVQVVARLVTDTGSSLTETQADTGGFVAAFFLDDQAATAMPLNPEKTEFAGDLSIAPGTALLSASVSYPGYFSFRSRLFRLQAAVCKPKTLSLEVDTTGFRKRLAELEQGSVLLRPKLDGQSPTAAQFGSFTARLGNDPDLRFTLEPDAAATLWVLRPKLRAGCACLTATGPQSLRIAVESTEGLQAETVVNLTVEDPGWWARCRGWVLGLLAALGFLWYVVGIHQKPRFRQGTVIFYERGGRRRTEPLPGSFIQRWLIPFRPERRRLGDVVFVAGRSGAHILLAKETQNERMSLAGQPLDEPGRRDLVLANGESLRIAGRQPETYTYSSL